MGILLDLARLSEPQTDVALGAMYKAIHDHGGDDIWMPIEGNPFIARLVELFTQRGLDRLDAFRKALLAWSEGQRHNPTTQRPPRPDGSMERWSPGEAELVRLYLESLPPEQWTLDDHMMLVDWLVQRYLPADDLRSEASWLASRAVLMGRVQASMAKLSARQADTLLAALPSVDAADDVPPPIRPLQRAIMEFARTRAAENVRKISDDVRHRMRGIIALHVEGVTLGSEGPGSSLQTKLLDEFATLNRDWRRIAITEAGEAQGQGYIASLAPGAKVKRIEQYRGACGFCRKIDGRVMDVVAPDAPEKDGDTQIWAGKNNIGRSAAPRKRMGDLLVEREPHELWWVPAGVAHPHCRGRWLPVIEDLPGDDKEFGDWLRATLAPKKKEPAEGA